jgi:hypothetical protein
MTTKVEYGEYQQQWGWGCRVFVGGCIERGIGSSFRRKAHAHNSKRDPNFGWVCVRSAKRVVTDDGKPTHLMWHEYAHILVPNQGHTKKWKAKMHELGKKAV